MEKKEILVQIQKLIDEANGKIKEAYDLAAKNQIIISSDLDSYNRVIVVEHGDAWNSSSSCYDGDWDYSSC